MYYANGLVYHGCLNNGNRHGFGRFFNGNEMYHRKSVVVENGEDLSGEDLIGLNVSLVENAEATKDTNDSRNDFILELPGIHGLIYRVVSGA